MPAGTVDRRKRPRPASLITLTLGAHYAKPGTPRHCDWNGRRKHGNHQQHGGSGTRPQHRRPYEARGLASDGRRISNTHATGLDSAIHRILARNPWCDGLQHPWPAPAYGMWVNFSARFAWWMSHLLFVISQVFPCQNRSREGSFTKPFETRTGP